MGKKPEVPTSFYFDYLNGLVSRELTDEIYRLENEKKPLNFITRQSKELIEDADENPDDYVFSSWEDMRKFIEIEPDSTYVYPVYDESEEFQIYKTSSYLPANGLVSLNAEVEHKALGVSIVRVTESITTRNNSDTQYNRQQVVKKIEEYFIYDFEEKCWIKVPNIKDYELQDRLHKIKLLEKNFRKITADFYSKFNEIKKVNIDSGYTNRDAIEFFQQKILYLTECVLPEIFVMLFNNDIDTIQYEFLKYKIESLKSDFLNLIKSATKISKNEQLFLKEKSDTPDEYLDSQQLLTIDYNRVLTQYNRIFGTVKLTNLIEKFKKKSELPFIERIELDDVKNGFYIIENLTKNDKEKLKELGVFEFYPIPTLGQIVQNTAKTNFPMKETDFKKVIKTIIKKYKKQSLD